MVKALTSAKPGALLEVGVSKDSPTIAAIKERTGVDRKTLTRIQQGKPVKQSTLQQVARKLAVPVSRLLSDQSSLAVVSPSAPNTHPKTEVQLRGLDTALLHDILSGMFVPEGISWHVDLLSLTQRQEELVLEFENKVNELDKLVNGYDEWGDGKNRSLKGQLMKLRVVSTIEERIVALNAEGIGVFGALDTGWWRHHDDDERRVITYESFEYGLIGFASVKLKTLTITVTDYSPLTQFNHLLPRPQKVIVDGKIVWDSENDIQF